MIKQYIALAAIVIIMVVATVISLDILPNSTIPLSSVEVTEYQGQELSSASDFRETPLKVPSMWILTVTIWK